ncbi:C2 calcium-dependent domain-containing protein 4A [Labrus bergylta]|uniref:C2 calcium-dependent domain-containing protein 4A n=1 Tax=Labrus bergylta TaxID=56723 RepID=UPI0009B4CF5B|nr:C2 calcium-dependent domain-containing protein 4A-like [Labrus bergylta]XP_029136555.1 C2 calcium-dependent domain-containing protein 4A-like [Labrus bergylta]
MSLRSLVLTPERIPGFFVPSRSQFLSPRPHRSSPDRTRLLADHDDIGQETTPPTDPAQHRRLLCLRAPRVRRPCPVSADVDLTTRAALSLPHIQTVTTPYGFSAVLAASPCTSRRESLFHRHKPVTVTVTDTELEDSSPPPGRSRECLGPIRALGLQVMKELKKPVSVLKALSPTVRRRKK